MSRIIPAIITDNKKEVQKKLDLVKGLVEWAQIDIMDGKFVDNKSIKIKELGKINTDINLEVHLMVENPSKYLKKLKRLGIKRILFHFEAIKKPKKILKKMEKHGFESGIVLNPDTKIEDIEKIVKYTDIVMFMGVQPGFGGQKFIKNTINKIEQFKAIHPDIKVSVDGGVNLENIAQISKAGADYFCVGSGLFNSNDILIRLKELEVLI